MTANLNMNNQVQNKVISLYDTGTVTDQTGTAFAGFGADASTLIYQVPSSSAHSFRTSTGATTSTEIMNINSTGATLTGRLLSSPMTNGVGSIGLGLASSGGGTSTFVAQVSPLGGTISITTTASSPGGADQIAFTVTYPTAYANIPSVVFSVCNYITSLSNYYIDLSTTKFDIYSSSAFLSTKTYVFSWQIVAMV